MRYAANEQATIHQYVYEVDAKNLYRLLNDLYDYVDVESANTRDYFRVRLTQEQVNKLVHQDQDRAISDRYHTR